MANPKGSGKGGRPPKSNRVKKIMGAKKERINEDEPAMIDGNIVQYDNLGKVGKKIFEHYSPMLINAKYLAITDSITFHLFCKVFEEWFQAEEKVRKEGRYRNIRNKYGEIIDVKENPWSKVQLKLYDQLLKIMRELGMTPQSRGSLKLIATGKEEKGIKQIT
jgi:P27 family predicted phage terminase small subunit